MPSIEAYKADLAAFSAASQAAAAARLSFRTQSQLPGLGSESWHLLWNAARRYSETVAYAGERFPLTGPGALCVLCQQTLTTEAGVRLLSFEEFVEADVQQQFEAARERVQTAKTDVEAIRLPRSVRAALRAAALEAGLQEHVRAYLVTAKCRRRLWSRSTSTISVQLPELASPPSIEEVIVMTETEISQLRTASKDDARFEMQRQRSGIRDRLTLAEHAVALRNEIQRLGTVRNLDRAIAGCNAQTITLKARQVATTIVTNRLSGNFATHLADLGVSEASVQVKLGAGDHGKHPYEVKLLPMPDVPPQEVLSEGERTCVALAGLLAELETTNNYSGVVFDDPVSSLDHVYRKRVAEKLVVEARRRQVIILTHDIIFVFLLRKYAQELNVSPYDLTLERGYKGRHGKVTIGPPWIAMSVKQRINALRDDLVEARRLLKAGSRSDYERAATPIYTRLRQTWERAIEEILLNGIVVRFGDSVQTQRLAKLTDICDADVELVRKEMSRCSDFVHDEAGVVHADLPEPDVVEADITRLETWTKELRTKRGRS